VSPYSVKYDNLDTLNGPFIKVTQLSGETSGRFRVARVIARVFPTQKAFADGVIKEGIEPASERRLALLGDPQSCAEMKWPHVLKKSAARAGRPDSGRASGCMAAIE
jgi:hypothetical protein